MTSFTPHWVNDRYSVIYQWTNLVNGKIYIGSACDVYERYTDYRHGHLDSKSKEFRRPIMMAMRKYGFDNFRFSVLEVVEDKQRLVSREQFYFDLHLPFDPLGYNICRKAGSMLGFKMPVESIRKIWSKRSRTLNLTSEQRQHRIDVSTGRRHTAETRRRISESAKSRPFANSKSPPVPIYQIDKITLKPVNSFSSIKSAAEAVNGKPCSISLCIHRHITSCYGSYWVTQKEYDQGGFVPRPYKYNKRKESV